MEPDSTTYDTDATNTSKDFSFPFSSGPCNMLLYKEFVKNSDQRIVEIQIVERLQAFGLLPSVLECLENKPTCKVVCKPARVVDRVQWVCEGCKKRQPIRSGSFFLKLQCSIIQALQMVLAWCEDADINVAAEYFDVKPRVASSIYDKLDELAAAKINNSKLGGEDAVVLAEMYPECLNRLSPDTTDQPHVHPILMLADTKHIPTHYRLHVMKEHLKRITNNNNEQYLESEVESVLVNVTADGSFLVNGHTLPPLGVTHALSHLTQHCDVDMQRFLSSRIWSQALSLCSASRDLCRGPPSPPSPPSAPTPPSPPSPLCATLVQRYLDVASYRLRYGDGFYEHMLNVIAERFTAKFEMSKEE